MKLPPKKGYHRHHIVPKFLGGTDEVDNLVYLTPEEHAQAHLDLYEKYGRKEDIGAYRMLHGEIIKKQERNKL